MNKKIFRSLTLIAGLLLAGQVWAGTSDDAFAAGLKASRGGDYLYALSRFELARRSGMDSAALDYNLGVCHYKLRHYPQASEAFRRATRSKELKPLALYNLGLVALAQRDHAQAEQWFTQARDASTEEDVRTLAERQLTRLQQPSGTDLKQWWLVSASANLGHDDNVLDPASEVVRSRSDNLAELFAIASGPISGTLRDGVRLDVSAYALRYASISEYDMNVLRGGAAWLHLLGNWQGEAGLHYETSSLGGEGYLDTTTLTLQGSHKWREDAQLRLRYRYGLITSRDDAYDPLQGTRQQFDIQNRWRRTDGQLLLGYQLELNNRDDLTTATTFSSYSPTRHTLRLGVEQALASPWIGGLDASLRNSRYDTANVLGSGRHVVRQDNQFQLKLRARRPLDKTWEVALEYSHTRNDSNINIYDYDRNLIMGGVSAQW